MSIMTEINLGRYFIMDKHYSKPASMALMFTILMIILSSCGNIWFGTSGFPEGYTGGFEKSYGPEIEYYWVETYEEALEAINLLKSHGSTFEESVIFTYEGDMFDTKYCFKMSGSRDYVKFGDNPYDRWAENVEITAFGFLENISIDELVYSYFYQYDPIYCFPISSGIMEACSKNPDISCEDLKYTYSDSDGEYYAYYENEILVRIGSTQSKEELDQYIEVIKESLIFIGFDD